MSGVDTHGHGGLADLPETAGQPDAAGRSDHPGLVDGVGLAAGHGDHRGGDRPPGPLLATGRDADVYLLDQRRVLRRYRRAAEVEEEAAVMRYLRGQGYPVPEVHAAEGTDLVLERLSGPTMRAALLGGELAPRAAGETLARLHVGLHALPPRRAAAPDARVLHLDLHPDNVMLESRGPVVIDWSNATEGPPDLDVAMTALILAEAAVGSHVPAEYRPAAYELLAAFLAGAGGAPLTQLDAALARRGGDRNLTEAERARLADAAAAVHAAVARP